MWRESRGMTPKKRKRESYPEVKPDKDALRVSDSDSEVTID